MEIDTAKYTFTQIFLHPKMLLIAFQHNAPKNVQKWFNVIGVYRYYSTREDEMEKRNTKLLMKRTHTKDPIINFERVTGSFNIDILKLGIIAAESNKILIHIEYSTRLYFHDPCTDFKNIWFCLYFL